MLKRFVERFQLWLKERADEREDKFIGWLLFVAVVIIVGDAYTFFTAHRVSADSILGTILMLAFVVMYNRQARWTWIVLMVLAVSCFAYIPAETGAGQLQLRVARRSQLLY